MTKPLRLWTCLTLSTPIALLPFPPYKNLYSSEGQTSFINNAVSFINTEVYMSVYFVFSKKVICFALSTFFRCRIKTVSILQWSLLSPTLNQSLQLQPGITSFGNHSKQAAAKRYPLTPAPSPGTVRVCWPPFTAAAVLIRSISRKFKNCPSLQEEQFDLAHLTD